MRLNRFTIVAAVAVIVALAVVALTASGGGGGDTRLVSGSAIAQAARATEKVPGASASMDATVDVDGLSEPLKMHLEGVEDMRGHSGRFAGSYSNLPNDVPGQSADGTIPVESVSILPDVYMKSPVFDAALPDGKSWLHIDFVKQGKKLGIGDPGQFGQADPSESVGNLKAVSDKVERVGSENVRGVPTTHYRATVELKKLPVLAPPSQRASARQRTDRLIQLLGSDSYPVEVWVDRHQLVRRTHLTMKMKIPPQNQRMTMDMTIEMYGFGPKPKAKRPPADETFDAP